MKTLKINGQTITDNILDCKLKQADIYENLADGSKVHRGQMMSTAISTPYTKEMWLYLKRWRNQSTKHGKRAMEYCEITPSSQPNYTQEEEVYLLDLRRNRRIKPSVINMVMSTETF